MLEFKSIRQNAYWIDAIKDLYESSFPEDEQVPFAHLCEHADGELSDLFAIVEEDVFIGLLCTVYDEDLVFLWYLAIVPALRNLGYGSRVLQEVALHFPTCRLLLNIEEVCDEKTWRRKHFYLKNGFMDCKFKTEEYGIVYEMLYKGSLVRYNEYEKMMRKYCGDEVYDRIYRLVE